MAIRDRLVPALAELMARPIERKPFVVDTRRKLLQAARGAFSRSAPAPDSTCPTTRPACTS
jgi:hypothetical protein